MRNISLFALALFSSSAWAASELQLESSMPVQLFIDGESQGTVQPHEPLLVDIDDGVHNLTIKGLMGKQLYDRDLIFDNDTRTELLWQRKELRLGQVVQLDPARSKPAPTLPVAPAAPPPAVAVAPAVPAPVAAPTPLAAPAPVAAPVAAAPAVPVTVPVVAAPAPVASPFASSTSSGGLTIQANEGLDLRILHGNQVLQLVMENGELVLKGDNGTVIRFPAAK